MQLPVIEAVNASLPFPPSCVCHSVCRCTSQRPSVCLSLHRIENFSYTSCLVRPVHRVPATWCASCPRLSLCDENVALLLSTTCTDARPSPHLIPPIVSALLLALCYGYTRRLLAIRRCISDPLDRVSPLGIGSADSCQNLKCLSMKGHVHCRTYPITAVHPTLIPFMATRINWELHNK